MSINKIKAVIFDGDGMVINGEMFYTYLVRDFGVKAELTNEFYANEFQLCLIGEADLKEELKSYLEKLGWDKTMEEFLNYWFSSEHNTDQRIIDVITSLKERGIKCYLASNEEKYHAKYMEDDMGIGKIFDKIYFSHEIGYIKPQKEFYDYIISDLSKNGIEKGEVLYWDDRKKNVDDAVKDGLNAELYKNFEDFQNIMRSYGLL